MKVLTLKTGYMAANAYIVYTENKPEAVIIDPGDDIELIMDLIKEHELKLEKILLTHGHFDHIGAVKDLKERTGAQVAIHKQEADFLTDPNKNLSYIINRQIVQDPADIFLEDGDLIRVADMEFKVLHTPGHTEGGVCYKLGKVLFTGDTLFEGSVGRTDLSGGSYEQLMSSIREKLLVLDDDHLVYPGHGRQTTIGRERRENPFLA
ncbi:MAG: MBL fold metallo-hydrolase [Caldicoprobacterales bacterium]|nr:MBL fold metallo-hydrolase [Clostridia bacterium]MDI9511862.1 MBL fold metallo-hydrolase [Bacillota bacterium]NLH59620.1 MBL fold metallo-hydrolase [Clostridiales bacterium]